MRAVLTVHGVGIFGGRGPWQKPIERVLAPHFHCITIKYSHYRWLGFLSAVVEPWVLVPAIVALYVLKQWYTVHFVWAWFIVALALSCIAARFRHRLALNHFLLECSARLSLGLRPHVIAHSMGTKLVGTALEDYPQVWLNNIVLTGCVLPTNYPWREVQVAKPQAFARVRNEVAMRDLVPWLAHKAHQLRILRGFGMAGRVGFDAGDFVHTTSSPGTPCAECILGGRSAPVHNVMIRQYGHSSVFATPEFAAYFWLPFFWNIDPAEYSEFLEFCRAADQHYQDHDVRKLRIAEEELLHSQWRWTEGSSLAAFIDRYVSVHSGTPAMATPVVALVLRKIWQDVAAACDAYHDRGPGWEQKITALNPMVAVLRAVDAILG